MTNLEKITVDSHERYLGEREKVSRRNKIRRSTPEAKEKSKRYNLKRLYGIELEQYNELLEKQNHSCAVCLKHESTFRVGLAVDHDHKTGEIFGLLCVHCNHRVIGRNRDYEKFLRAAKYLEKGTGLFVPPRVKKKRKKKPLAKVLKIRKTN